MSIGTTCSMPLTAMAVSPLGDHGYAAPRQAPGTAVHRRRSRRLVRPDAFTALAPSISPASLARRPENVWVAPKAVSLSPACAGFRHRRRMIIQARRRAPRPGCSFQADAAGGAQHHHRSSRPSPSATLVTEPNRRSLLAQPEHVPRDGTSTSIFTTAWRATRGMGGHGPSPKARPDSATRPAEPVRLATRLLCLRTGARRPGAGTGRIGRKEWPS